MEELDTFFWTKIYKRNVMNVASILQSIETSANTVFELFNTEIYILKII